MALTREEVLHVAQLARLGLAEADVERLQSQLSDTIAYFQILDSLDTSAIPPTAQVIDQQSVMRSDVVRPSFSPEEVLANAPRTEDGFFRIKAVLED
ncbi:MAG: Asp-tRNA(Asn)/Glu-tRNA(Gln) amidotransferase subunit GatC [Dehalococcoidia bacterium]|nr:Asp-tRNA(Asn)/Glu-tRNA(Gln) amidotransferase subunit GatC [Dehalococcoidia bacterium]